MNSVVFFGTSSRSNVLSCFAPSEGGGGGGRPILARALSCGPPMLGLDGSVGGLSIGGGAGKPRPAPPPALPLLLTLTRPTLPEASMGGGGGTTLRALPVTPPEARRGGGGGTALAGVTVVDPPRPSTGGGGAAYREGAAVIIGGGGTSEGAAGDAGMAAHAGAAALPPARSSGGRGGGSAPLMLDRLRLDGRGGGCAEVCAEVTAATDAADARGGGMRWADGIDGSGGGGGSSAEMDSCRTGMRMPGTFGGGSTVLSPRANRLTGGSAAGGAPLSPNAVAPDAGAMDACAMLVTRPEGSDDKAEGAICTEARRCASVITRSEPSGASLTSRPRSAPR